MVNYTETSIKITPCDVQTYRRSVGFFPGEVDNVSEFIIKNAGQESYDKFIEYFPKEIENPDPSRLMMLGSDGNGFEFYVEYGDAIASYDCGKGVEFVYHRIPREQYEFVYEYMRRILPAELIQALINVVPIEKCSHLWVKNSPSHRFVYLFKIQEGVPVPDVRSDLGAAAAVINPDEIQFDDSLHVVLLGLAVTSEGHIQFSIYFRDLTSFATSGPSSGD
ncbi:hypothetical protein [Yellowstone lake phycodnavirus 3]|jgi:hypothetical protein|uniref:hypothetical protein n=1 Tax=Yellowstone lake phycodnavirus 3 TaxID=1586715 RepID=UPI0006EB4E00|nr:hypothetical protein AR677_gp008 [Yellowstone lake phycodnavirus 3]BAT22507.1 hypothetical protein [Yellowstone lake phycodnavirus 3]